MRPEWRALERGRRRRTTGSRGSAEGKVAEGEPVLRWSLVGDAGEGQQASGRGQRQTRTTRAARGRQVHGSARPGEARSGADAGGDEVEVGGVRCEQAPPLDLPRTRRTGTVGEDLETDHGRGCELLAATFHSAPLRFLLRGVRG